MSNEKAWTAWTGGQCPIDEGEYIEVMYRNDESEYGYACNYDWQWMEDDADNDIVSYRILSGDER